MYQPSWTETDSCKTQSWFEWIEVKNISAETIDLTSWTIGDSGYSDALAGQIEPSSYAVIVAKEECFRQSYPNFSGKIIVLGSYIGNGLKDSGDSVVLSESGTELGRKDYVDGAAGEGNSLSLISTGSWIETAPTPGADNESTSPADPIPEEPDATQPTISFSAPMSTVAGAEFTVTVNLSNFNSGSYYLKVLVGKGDKFYDGRTYGTNGLWLAWNAGWADFPKISVGSSGSASQIVKAKTDGDIFGGYEIKIRTYDDKNTRDSQVKNISVKAEPEVVSATSEVSGGAAAEDDETGEDPTALGLAGGGEVLGEVNQEGKNKFVLNFYLVTGFFGLLVGSGGIILAFRRGPKELQKAGSRKLGSENP